jgi:hypothetical protein
LFKWFSNLLSPVFGFADKFRSANDREKAAINQAETAQVMDGYSSARSYKTTSFLGALVRPYIALTTFTNYIYVRHLQYQTTGIIEFNEYDYSVLGAIITFYFGGRIYEKTLPIRIQKKQIKALVKESKKGSGKLKVSVSDIKDLARPELADITAAVMLTESAGNPFATRFEKHVYKKRKNRLESSSWGLFQIMGYNLQNLGLELSEDSLVQFLNNIPLQVEYFNRYYDRELKGKYTSPEELYALYNGGIRAHEKLKATGSAGAQVDRHIVNFMKHFNSVSSLFGIVFFLAIGGLYLANR